MEVLKEYSYTLPFLIANHTHFKRDKDNLYSTQNLDLYTAILMMKF
jgi:DnaJ-class molecular chaperone